jgi:hypothetical protein
MKQREGARPQAISPEAREAGRKPYQKPAVRYERVFETRALSCGKVHATQGPCHFEAKHS